MKLRVNHTLIIVFLCFAACIFTFFLGTRKAEAETELDTDISCREVIAPTKVTNTIPTVVPTITITTSPTPTPSPSPTPTPTPLPEPFSGQSTFKSYESYKSITNTKSPQYKLQQEAYTGDYGIRMVDGRYCVAMGSYWATEIGTKMDVYLESGEVIPVILGDNKQDCHTTNKHRVGTGNKDVLEFIVDTSEIPSKVKNCGSFNCIFTGKVSAVVIVED